MSGTTAAAPASTLRGLFLAVFLMLWVLAPAAGPSGDARVMDGVAANLAVHGDLAFDYPSPGYTVRGDDGHDYGKFPLPWSLVEVPGQLLERMLSTSGLAPADKALYTRLVRGVTPAATGAAAVVLLAAALLALGSSPRSAAAVSLAAHLATCALPYMRSHWSEVLQVALVNAAILATVRFRVGPSRRRAVLLGAVAGSLLLAKVSLAPFAVAVVLGAIVPGGPRPEPPRRLRARLLDMAWLAAGAVPPLALFAWYNVVRFGTPVSLSYGFYLVPVGLGHPLADGLFGLLLSPGRGLLWFAPASVLGLAGAWVVPRPTGVARDRVVAAMAGGFLATLLFYSAFTIWHGGEQWGPRFLVPMTGPLAVLAAPVAARAWRRGAWARAGIAALVAAGLLVNMPAVLVPVDAFFRVVPYRPYSEVTLDADMRPLGPVEVDNLHRVNYVPAFSPIRGQAWLAAHALLGGDLASDCPWRDQVGQGPILRTPALSPSIDLWWIPGASWPDGTRAAADAILALMVLAMGGAVFEAARQAHANRT